MGEILAGFEGKPGELIPALQAIQREYGHLPPGSLEAAAERLGVPLSRVYGVATFYAQFRLQKRGRHLVQVCQGTACHVRGGAAVLEALERELGLMPGEGNGRWSLEVVRCVGCCSLAPVMVVDGKAYGRLTPSKALEILRGLDEGEED